MVLHSHHSPPIVTPLTHLPPKPPSQGDKCLCAKQPDFSAHSFRAMVMEFLYSSLILVPLFLLLILFKTIQIHSSKLPPGPRGLPIIGSIHHLLGSPPHRALRDLATTHGPLMHLWLGQVPWVVVSSAEAAKEVLKTHDAIFATRPETLASKAITYGFLDLVFAPYGEYWRQLRKLCVLELLSARRVHSFRSIREEETRNLVRSICAMASTTSMPVNLSEMLISLTNTVTTRATLGNKCRDQMGYLEALREARTVVTGFQLVDFFPRSTLVRLLSRAGYKIESCHKKMDRCLEGIIEEHIERRKMGMGEAGTENLLDVLLALQEQGELGFSTTNNNNIKAVIFDMFAAGTGTPASTMVWAMSELMKNPRVMERAQTEVREVMRGRTLITEEDTHKLSYLQLIIKETLRLHPPVPLLTPRECTESCQIQGYTIPAKTRVVVNTWAMGRDPQYWDDPEAFKPERFDGNQIDFKGDSFEYVPFGAGRRICPGIAFGLATMELALAHLLYYFDWKLPYGLEPDELDMTESFGFGVRRKSDLRLRAVPRVHLPGAQVQ